MRLVVTGGAGFIGAWAVRRAIAAGADVLTIDKLTYAADLGALAEFERSPNHHFAQIDVADAASFSDAVQAFDPDAVLHLAAESHVDRSIDAPAAFVASNVLGALSVLEATLRQQARLTGERRDRFRLVFVSTDEVCGALGPDGRFDETTPLAPNSPYAASKAAGDLLARAWTKTYGAPIVVTRSSNNFGPGQHPEKLIPTILRTAIAGDSIPIYGNGAQVRDWIYVEDHVDGLFRALERGALGDVFMFGGGEECSNLSLTRAICAELDLMRPRDAPHARAITHVTDRPGHDFRYATDSSRAAAALGWRSAAPFASALRATINWYLDDPRRLDRTDAHPRRGLRESTTA